MLIISTSHDPNDQSVLLPEALRARRAAHRQMARYYETRARGAGGMITRNDSWRLEYLRDPYLLRAANGTLHQMHLDVYGNMMELDEQGRLSPKPSMNNDAFLMRRFTALDHEWSQRGGLSEQMLSEGNLIYDKYFRPQQAVGVKLFEGIPPPGKSVIVKYTKDQFAVGMYDHGRIWVSPAANYSSASHNSAIRDVETKRQFIVPSYEEYLGGVPTIAFDGRSFDLTQGDPEFHVDLPNYYALCFCAEIDRRLPTDFEADAAVIIHDVHKFSRRVRGALERAMPGGLFQSGPISYYDPYTDYKKYKDLRYTKHFRFYYQKEYRITYQPVDASNLLPIDIEIGSMKDYAHLVRLK